MTLDTNITILLVEDFKFTRKLEIQALNKLGFTNIIEAGDFDEAIALLESDTPIDLIISDWNMPGKDGLDLLKWVRSGMKWRKTPFMMASAKAEKRDTQSAADAGASGFITKPFTAEDLKMTIESVMRDPQDPERGFPEEPQSAPEIRFTASGRLLLNVAHIQITDHLILGVLKHLIAAGRMTPRHFELETKCMSGWNPVRRALERKEVDAAFIMAPIAMDLYASGCGIRLTLFAHKNGSICVKNVKTPDDCAFQQFFTNKIFYIPHVLSVHHMLSYVFFNEMGLKAGLMNENGADMTFEVIPPVRMPELMDQSQEVSGFMVAQPIGAKTIHNGDAELLFLSGQLWEGHPCCVVTIQDELIQQHEDAVYEFIDLLVQAGQYIENNPAEAARIAVQFLDPEKELQLSPEDLEEVLKEPSGVKFNDLFPVIKDLNIIQHYMKEQMNIGNIVDLDEFVDLRFAKAACARHEMPSVRSAFRKPSELVQELFHRNRVY